MKDIIRKAFTEKTKQLFSNLKHPLLICNLDGQNRNYWMFTLQPDHSAPAFLLILPSGEKYAFVSPIETSLLEALNDKIRIVAYNSGKEIIPLIKKYLKNKKTILAEYSDNFNFDILSYSWVKKLKKEFKLKSASDVLFPLRAVKTETEIELIEKSVKTTFEILMKLENLIRPGTREIDIYNFIYYEIRKRNAEVSFKAIVASGERAVNPHTTRAKDKKLKKGELLIVDMGLSFYGYTSDITRTFLIGGDVRNHQFYKVSQEMFNKLESSGLSKIAPFQLARIMKSISKKHKVDIYEKHSYGHGIGVAVHDVYPVLSPLKTKFNLKKFQDNMAFAFEPGFYADKEGFRWENDYFVKEGRAIKF